ncbi:doublecortin domain-containing protein 2-like [Palaemon carinicauda]|uniref:doublecortin domain-containing protein 2-like n=1 Tax=Palaemon carinicauda TaxID=392227 RepID=UPI0035B5C5AD
MLRNYQLPEGKRIKVYKSGDTYYTGKSMVVNPMQIKTLDNLINVVTSKVDPDWGAVRSIHTPNTGTVVENLDTINRDGVYVAAGAKGFVSVPGGYENIGKPGIKKKFAGQKTIHRAGLKNEVFNIKVFKNGEGGVPVPFKFSKSDISNWDQALYRLSEKVRLPQGQVKRIYHVNGKIVKSPSDIVNNGTYVVAASNETFRNATYGDMPADDIQSSGGSKGFGQRFTKKGPPSRKDSGESDKLQSDDKKIPMKLPTKKLTRRPRTESKEDEDPRRFSSSDSKKLGPGRAKANMKIITKGGEVTTEGSDTNKSGRKFSKSKSPTVVASKLQSRSKLSSRRNSANDQTRGNTSQSTGTKARQSSGGGTTTEESKKSSRFSKGRNNRSRVPSPVTREMPSEIPESSDPGSVEYLNLKSEQNTPYQSPHETPVNSRPSSPQYNYDYRRRAGSIYSLPEAIAEEVEEEEEENLSIVEEVNSESGTTSRTSYIDSGHVSLLSDEDRPDSVFKAKARSRPVTMAREVDYDTDDGGIYRAKSKSDYVRGAREILDSSVTKIEIPIDLLDAKEVQEQLQIS